MRCKAALYGQSKGQREESCRDPVATDMAPENRPKAEDYSMILSPIWQSDTVDKPLTINDNDHD
jgi:hypothetical protein